MTYEEFVVWIAEGRFLRFAATLMKHHHAVQAALVILSAAAITLIALPAPYQRWGYVVGLASQPMWFVATWRARQWGMLLLTAYYSIAWCVGIANHFAAG